jgi:DNA polymerase
MAIVTIDFESFYSKDYSLKKMSECDYILDHRFETIMVAIKVGDGPTIVHKFPSDIREALDKIDWSNSAMLSHNTRFDGAILAWHYGHIPGLYLDSMSMARAITHASLGSSSLAKLATYFRLPAKGDAVVNAMGKTRADFTQDELDEYADYCAHDTDLCRAIYDRLKRNFPNSELKVIDLALRQYICPQVKLDETKLAEHLNLVRAEKAQAFAKVAHIPASVFSSNQQFAELLQTHNVEVPTKISTTTGSETWALAKNDRDFKDLCNDPDQPADVQALLACRLNAKSTIEETRTVTLLNLAQRDWSRRVGVSGTRWMPVPYRYYGAHTGRFSGDGGYNFANLKRGSPIRGAITAPEGMRIVHRDSSQIEARIVAWLAKCEHLVTAFAEGRDVYSEFASKFYKKPVTKADTKERFTGKTAILSLGYGAGAAKFRHALYIGSGGVSLDLTLDQARELVSFYRDTYWQIPELWRKGNYMLDRMIQPQKFVVEPNIPVIQLGEDCIYLPNGLTIQYPKLRSEIDPDDVDRKRKVYDGSYGGVKKIYGAKAIENITQALARIVVTDIALRVHRETGFHPFMSTYDSHDYCVPEREVYDFDRVLESEFMVVPEWGKGLPLASEGGWGRTLLEAEKGVNQ